MIAVKNARIHIAILLVLLLPWLGTAYAQLPVSPPIHKEVSKQEGIYHSRGEKVPEGYVIDRSLLDYTDVLPAKFNRSLANLDPTGRWLDIGAGTGQAILDYYTPKYDAMHPEARQRRGKKARAVAISIEDRRTSLWPQTAANLEAGQIQYLFGKRFRDYLEEELGKFNIITDFLGGFSYTESLSGFMAKLLGLLDLNGNFYTILQDVHAENGTNRPYYPDARFLTEIANADGSEVKVCSWLKRITCVEVTCELRADWKPPVEVYRIRKVCNNISIPALVPIHFEAGTPPERRFQFEKSLPELPGRIGVTP